ncbi:MAG: hypothetical protein PWP16_1442 [Eubacteriaceae bacterium]|jgi:hypothetical protein|nr:hypothetical protein [Eubacteriaceae bacterium]MDK2962281.1 hypothetical protein [Eubacteriaceae bacterium]MDN5308079.1 hypothetical protein [Eubacteriaceae bacterium]
MIYIPKEWLNNADNEQKVQGILSKYFINDINYDITLMTRELEAIGETIIIEKIKTGAISA